MEEREREIEEEKERNGRERLDKNKKVEKGNKKVLELTAEIPLKFAILLNSSPSGSGIKDFLDFSSSSNSFSSNESA